MQLRTRGRSLRRGFTAAEILVSVAIVALLLAVLVPAVQRVRAAARVTTCSNHLHQVGVALLHVESTQGAVETRTDQTWRQLLPALEQGGLSIPTQSECPAATASMPELLTCPEDGWAGDGQKFRSYHMNDGTRFRDHELVRNGFVASVTSGGLRRFRDITDGTSATAMISEHLVDRRPELFDMRQVTAHQRRILWFTPKPVLGHGEEAQFNALCRGERRLPTIVVQSWVAPGLCVSATYDHFLTPNEIGCWNGPESGFSVFHSAVPASSLHAGGVNVLMCDGAVRFVSETIDAGVWSATGTIASHEAAARIGE